MKKLEEWSWYQLNWNENNNNQGKIINCKNLLEKRRLKETKAWVWYPTLHAKFD